VDVDVKRKNEGDDLWGEGMRLNTQIKIEVYDMCV
jgi:hypothetical protein